MICDRESGGGYTGTGNSPSASPPTECLSAPLVHQRFRVAVGMWSVSPPTHGSLTFASHAGLECLQVNKTQHG